MTTRIHNFGAGPCTLPVSVLEEVRDEFLDFEGIGMSFLEAMAAGVPVVQPRCSSFPELIEMTGGGICYDHNGPESLAAAIEKLLHNQSEAKAMGLKGREVVREKFSIQYMADKMAMLYDELTPQTTEA